LNNVIYILMSPVVRLVCTGAVCADRILSCKMLREKPSLKSTVRVVNAKLSAALRTSNLRFGFRLFALLDNVWSDRRIHSVACWEMWKGGHRLCSG